MKENLFEHYDFEALYPSIWTHLYSWYSADTQIVRSLKTDGFIDNEFGTLDSQKLTKELHKAKSGNQETNIILDLYPSNLDGKLLNNTYLFYNESAYLNKNSTNEAEPQQDTQPQMIQQYNMYSQPKPQKNHMIKNKR